jgi:hypothetical protein
MSQIDLWQFCGVSIYNNLGDIYSVMMSVNPVLCGNIVQESYDMSALVHLIIIKSRIPF